MTQNNVIWKSILYVSKDGLHTLQLPAGAEILCAREQFDEPCIWYRCDPMASKVKRTFALVSTGHPAPAADEGRYCGTASLRGGALILHVFEELKS